METNEPGLSATKSHQRQHLVVCVTSTDEASSSIETPERQATHVMRVTVGDAGLGDPVEQTGIPIAYETAALIVEGPFQSGEPAPEHHDVPVGTGQVVLHSGTGTTWAAVMDDE